MSIRLSAAIAEKVGFASHQNAVPILRDLEIHNEGATDFADLVLTLSALPDAGQAEAARDVAQMLIAGYGGEAVNVALKCQNAFMERGEDAAAAGMLSVLTAIWEIEDSPRA